MLLGKQYIAAVALLVNLMSGPARADEFNAVTDRSLYTGFYMTWRFGDTRSKQGWDPLVFGIKATVPQPLSPADGFTPNAGWQNITGRRQVELNLFDTRFNGEGLKEIRLAATPVVWRSGDGHLAVLGVDGSGDSEKPSGTGFGKLLLIAGGVAVGIVALAAIGGCVDGEPKDDGDPNTVDFDFCAAN